VQENIPDTENKIINSFIVFFVSRKAAKINAKAAITFFADLSALA